MEPYQQLLEVSREAKTLMGVMGLVSWDQETYMPKGAQAIRGEQLKLLAGLCHDMVTNQPYQKALGALVDLKTGQLLRDDLSEEQIASLREWHRDFVKATALPKEFVQQQAKLTSEALGVWQEAKEKNAFSLFAPYLEKLVEMSERKANYLGFAKHPYDALLDDYEPGLKAEEVEEIFSRLKPKIISLLRYIQSKPQVDSSFLHGQWDKELQMTFSKEILSAMGYDFAHGRIDVSSHPFSTSFHPTDSRVTTRMHTDNILDNVLATIHEGGHSLYEMGLPQEHFGSPLCEAVSLGIHESQSRFWETRIGQSKPFWRYFFPKLQKLFPEKLSSISLDMFYRAINRVEPTFIRVEADEVTYSLHVILRFEIEQALFKKTLSISDLPRVWKDKMEEYLGIRPPNDTLGCLQDIHWAMGGFGYFPTYTLGNLFAAHLFLPFARSFPDWADLVASGNLLFIRDWLRQKVHRHGRRYRSLDLLHIVHKETFSEEAYLHYLEAKYKEIY